MYLARRLLYRDHPRHRETSRRITSLLQNAPDMVTIVFVSTVCPAED